MMTKKTNRPKRYNCIECKKYINQNDDSFKAQSARELGFHVECYLKYRKRYKATGLPDGILPVDKDAEKVNFYLSGNF